MTPRIAHPALSALMLLAFMAGCRTARPLVRFPSNQPKPNIATSTAAEVSDGNETVCETQPVMYESEMGAYLSRPLTSLSDVPSEMKLISLDEAISIALQDTEVLRSLAATVVNNSDATPSALDPAIQSTDPNFGMEAALAKFDANLTAGALYSNNDEFFNNPAFTGGAVEVQEDLANLGFGLNKRSVTGTQLSISSETFHNKTTNPSVLFPTSWRTGLEATVRHPFLQGKGIEFNRIAGPNSQPGFLGSSGFLISRTNHDVSIAQFERSVREMVLEIANAYWQLNLAFKNFDVVKSGRDASLETWNIAKARFNNGLEGGEADREAEARGQYYFFQSQLNSSLNGTQANGLPGVYQAEANLRRLLNLPPSDSSLLFPSDDPIVVQSIWNWHDLAGSALTNRVEVKEQLWRVNQRELFLVAARNFTLPRLDGIAAYRNNGLGDDLLNSSGKFAGALNEAYSGNYDEWEFGFAFEMPIGFRQAYAGVRNASLRLARQKAILRELRKHILYDLGSSLRELDQSQQAIELVKLRRDAIKETVDARQAAYKADSIGFEDLLIAQRLLLDSELEYHRTKTDHELAREALRAESGRLLSEHRIILAEEREFPSNPCEAEQRKNRLRRVANDHRFRQIGAVDGR